MVLESPRLAGFNPPTLLALPNEVLIEISAHLDCASLLSIRMVRIPTSQAASRLAYRCGQCCKVLFSVTKSSQLWREVARRLCENYNLTRPERALQSYTAEELEYWCLVRNITQDIWKERRKARLRERTVHLPDGPKSSISHFSYILPGGRWILLVKNLSNIMYATDVEPVSPRLQVLLDEHRTHESLKYPVWNDRSCPQMFYRIAAAEVHYRRCLK
jgi:hypothetical protein